MRVCSMSRASNRCSREALDPSWTAQWDYMLVVRLARGIVHPDSFARHIATDWTYSVSKTSPTATYCTRHVCELIRDAYDVDIPILWFPMSVLSHLVDARVVFECGSRYDVALDRCKKMQNAWEFFWLRQVSLSS